MSEANPGVNPSAVVPPPPSADGGPGEPLLCATGRRGRRERPQRPASLELPGTGGPPVRLDHAGVRAAVPPRHRAWRLEGNAQTLPAQARLRRMLSISKSLLGSEEYCLSRGVSLFFVYVIFLVLSHLIIYN